jgi:hypothetical protein
MIKFLNMLILALGFMTWPIIVLYAIRPFDPKQDEFPFDKSHPTSQDPAVLNLNG